MPINIVVPQMSESVVEATVLRWLKQEGDKVSLGESVVELETEKANFEVAAEQSGVLVRIEKQEGADVKVGDTLAVIDESKGASASGSPKPETSPVQQKPKEAAPSKEPAKEPAKEEGNGKDDAAKVTPVAQNIAKAEGVDTSKVEPTGTSGRVTKEDVERYIEKQKGAPAEPAKKEVSNVEPIRKDQPQPQPQPEVRKPEIVPTPVEDGYRREERVRMSRRRRTIARRMVEAQSTAAILTTFNEVDMTAVMNLRKKRKESFKEKHGIGLGLNSFFVKAAIGALKAFPIINAEMEGDDTLIMKHYYDIGIAIGAPEGLIVPVIRDADRLTFAEIEKKVKDFAERSEKNTLTIEEMRGGTFTITNGGVFGSLMSTPILNPPQVGILGLHKIEERPMAINGQVVVRPMMYVALSYDHRVVDGRGAVLFLVKVKELIEDPEALLLEG